MKSLPVTFNLKKLQACIKATGHHEDCAQMGLDVLFGLKHHREIYHSGDIQFGLMVALEQAALDALADTTQGNDVGDGHG